MAKSNLCKTKETELELICRGIQVGMGLNGLDANEIASKLGCSVATVYNYKARPSTIPADRLFKLMKMAGVKIQITIGGFEIDREKQSS